MNLRFFSIKKIVSGAKEVSARFPLAMLAAFVGTITGVIFLHDSEQAPLYTKLLMTLGFGFTLFFSATLFGEQKKWSSKNNLITNAAIVVFLVIYYLLLPKNLFLEGEIFFIRYVMWMIGFLLLIMFAPFTRKSDEGIVNSFWRYNMNLASSLSLTILWALAFQIGISIAMASVSFLFEVSIEPERYMELWIVIVGIFSTAFFLSRVPKNIDDLQAIEEYPKELRLFFQYVLFPLVTVYFLILYAYVIRIIVTWEWPKGTLAYMVLGFSFLGVLSYAIARPLENKVNWISKASKAFFIALIPQIGMLFWALWFRLAQYSFTENRYFIFVFGWWLLAMAIYFLVSKKRDIRIIPISIFFIAFLASFGPWGAFAVSERSQANRLERLLLKNEILVNGKVEKASKDLSKEDAREISATVRYLISYHGVDSIQPLFNEDLETFGCENSAKNEDQIVNEKRAPLVETPECDETYYYRYDLPGKITETLIGVDYTEQWDYQNTEGKSFYLYTDYLTTKDIVDISKYDYMVGINLFQEYPAGVRNVGGGAFSANGVNYKFEWDNNTGEFVISEGGSIIAKADSQKFLKEILDRGQVNNLSRDEMKFEFENERISFVIYFASIHGDKPKDGKYDIESLDGMLLFTLR